MSIRNTTGEILYVNADWSKIVPESSPDAAFVLVGVGGRVPTEHEAVYAAHVDGDVELVEDEPTDTVIKFGGEDSPATDQPEPEPTPEPDPEPEQAETPKPRKRAARKKAAAKPDD